MVAGSAYASDSFALSGHTLGGRFQVEGVVAEGGFGVVYRAQQLALGRTVALKVFKVPAELAEAERAAFQQTFETEARTVARLRHPHIVEVHDFGVSDGPTGGALHWMALEWLEGQTLAELLAEERAQGRPRRDPVAAMELLKPVLEAVAFAHQQGVAHRDLKPANIFVVNLAGKTTLKVLDFGVAQLLAPDRRNGGNTTERGPVGFSPDYAAPEQVSYGRTGPWTDVHALGLMLTELLVCAAPYDAADPEARFAQVIAERRPTPGARGVDVGAWEPVLARALARRPANRYLDADALLRVLEASLSPPVPPTRRRSILVLAAIAALPVAGVGSYLGWRALEPTPATRITLAVLPFENLTGDPQQEYFSDGLTDGMIGELSRLAPGRLAVIARTSVARYKRSDKSVKEIGRELQVGYLLESSLKRSGNRVRVDAHLVQVADETQIWVQSYDREIKDVLALQSEIAQAIATGVHLRLSPAQARGLANPRPVHAGAYDAYLRGRYFWDKKAPEAHRQAMVHFEQAIKLDPLYAAAHSGLADVYALLQMHSDDPAADVGPKAKAAALRAVELDDQLGEAHAALAFIAHHYDWDWPAAERHYRRALELDPNNPDTHRRYGILLSTAGRFDEAMAEMDRALELAPMSLIANAHLGRFLYYQRRYKQAMERLERTLELEPDFWVAQTFLGWVYAARGMYREAWATFDRAADRNVEPLAARGYVHARAGRPDEATKVLEQLETLKRTRFVPSHWLARICAALDRHDEAFDHLEAAYRERNYTLIFLRFEPVWDPLRNDPRFADLVRRVGIPSPSVEVR